MDGEGEDGREGPIVHVGGPHSSSSVFSTLKGRPRAVAKMLRSHLLSPRLPLCSQCTPEQGSGDSLRVRSWAQSPGTGPAISGTWGPRMRLDITGPHTYQRPPLLQFQGPHRVHSHSDGPLCVHGPGMALDTEALGSAVIYIHRLSQIPGTHGGRATCLRAYGDPTQLVQG